ncbi:MAG TPA: hypothetical protein VLK58_13910, partial [Conexibacter sp.]|nr:hypothetical protein [Conexibacter sp.]
MVKFAHFRPTSQVNRNADAPSGDVGVRQGAPRTGPRRVPLKLSVRTKLLGGFLVLAVLIAAVGAIGIS